MLWCCARDVKTCVIRPGRRIMLWARVYYACARSNLHRVHSLVTQNLSTSFATVLLLIESKRRARSILRDNGMLGGGGMSHMSRYRNRKKEGSND